MSDIPTGFQSSSYYNLLNSQRVYITLWTAWVDISCLGEKKAWRRRKQNDVEEETTLVENVLNLRHYTWDAEGNWP